MYTISQKPGHYSRLPTLKEATDLAEALLGEADNEEETTITVENEAHEVVASVSNRRITGIFCKQQWGGRKGDDALPCGEEVFDATNAILQLDHADLVEMEDNSEQSDTIGFAHISWNGPCSVRLSDSICSFFGVTDVEDITPDNLAYVRTRMNPTPVANEVVVLSVKLNLLVTPGASVNEFIENLEYSVLSTTPGVIVNSTEIIDAA